MFLPFVRQMIGFSTPSEHRASGQILGGAPSQTFETGSMESRSAGETFDDLPVPATAEGCAIEAAGAVTTIIVNATAIEIREVAMVRIIRPRLVNFGGGSVTSGRGSHRHAEE